MKKLSLTVLLISLLFSACGKQSSRFKLSSADSLKILNEISTYRAGQDSFFRYSPGSPFTKDTTIHYNGLKYFDPDLSLYFKSKLYLYSSPETVIVLGTKGEERKQLKYGYFILPYKDEEYKINVYKFTPYDRNRYELYKDNLSFWFRDKTTDKETYHIGRYVEIGDENPDRNHEYVIDMNKAYNPYCAYSSLFSCAIPRDEDNLGIEVRAGEKKYHE
jgi:uncharacterized protein (DUF1684 family)